MSQKNNLLLSVLLCSIQLSCSLISIPFSKQNLYTRLEITVPAEYRTALAFCKIIDNDGNSNKIQLSPSKTFIHITVTNNKPTPFLFYTSDIDTKPIGCLYPVTNEVSNLGGFTAHIAFCLYNQSYGSKSEILSLISHFNWFKFYAILKTYTFETMWQLDQQAIITAIADGSFALTDLK